MTAYIGRGLATGLLAGLLAGLFALLFAEPTIDRAIALEGHGHNEGSHAASLHEEPFGRGAQKAGLVLATSLYGAACGLFFGLLYSRLRGEARGGEWRRSLALACALFFGAVVVPFLKYPPNPPGAAADPSTLGERTLAYLAAVALSLLAVLAARRFARALGDAPVAARDLAFGGVLLLLWSFLLLALPDFGASGGSIPPDLLWDFRLSSLGTQAVLWAGIGCLFGLLAERARRGGTP
ncbi:MAG: CbtA family protein [Actinomycetota bacterium]